MKTIALDISVLNDKQKTGIAVYTYQLIKALLENNQTDRFILFGIATFETFNYLKNIDLKKYPNVEIKVIKMPARLFRLAFLMWQKFNWPNIEIFIGKVDIFHSFNWYMPPQKSGKKVATIFDLTSILYPEWHDTKTSQLDGIRLKKISKEADLVITISENSKKDLQKYGVSGKVEVVYPAAFSPQSSVIRQSESWKLKTDSYFLSVATLEPRKNLFGLVKAYLNLETDIPLILVGKIGWKNSELFNLINGHEDKIILKGFVSDQELVKLYQDAICLVYPSFYEGFGIPVLEAMSLGTPVICSNTSSLPEVTRIWRGHPERSEGSIKYAALMVNPYQKHDLVQAMKKILEDSNLRKDLREKGFKQAKQFSWKESAKKLNELYQRL